MRNLKLVQYSVQDKHADKPAESMKNTVVYIFYLLSIIRNKTSSRIYKDVIGAYRWMDDTF